ncbi:hypothetical protein SEPCBS57363_002711 [Sporothrix epigloea]|uniref:F1f0 ATP synthase assembly protein n=1 Tax=Sporothrix epigloea TaxID=1892477 RepID=A0ABP0DKX9_9PEZI
MASRKAITAVAAASRPPSASLRPMRATLLCGRAACRSATVAASSILCRRPDAFRFYAFDSSSPGAQTSRTAPYASAAQDVIERYRSRLESKAQKEGVVDVEQLRAAYTDKIQALRRQDAILPKGAAVPVASAAKEPPQEAESTPELASAESSPSSSPSSPTSQASTPGTASVTTSTHPASAPPSPSPSLPSSAPSNGVRALSSLLDLDKVRALPAEELSAVWRLRFANDPLSLCAAIPAQTYAAMEAAARARPQFVLPVPHPEQGAEIHFLQWTFDTQCKKNDNGVAATPSSTVLFTQLAEYKVRGEFAQPHTTVTHYTDLAADCGMVLMQGQVAEGRGVTADHAQWLVMCLQRFYGAWSIPGSPGAEHRNSRVDEGAGARRQLLQWFAAGDPQFSIERLMEEVEKLA